MEASVSVISLVMVYLKLDNFSLPNHSYSWAMRPVAEANFAFAFANITRNNFSSHLALI